MVPDGHDADRPLSLVLAGQSIQRETVAATVQTLLQPKSAESGIRWPHARQRGAELDSARNSIIP